MQDDVTRCDICTLGFDLLRALAAMPIAATVVFLLSDEEKGARLIEAERRLRAVVGKSPVDGNLARNYATALESLKAENARAEALVKEVDRLRAMLRPARALAREREVRGASQRSQMVIEEKTIDGESLSLGRLRPQKGQWLLEVVKGCSVESTEGR